SAKARRATYVRTLRGMLLGACRAPRLAGRYAVRSLPAPPGALRSWWARGSRMLARAPRWARPLIGLALAGVVVVAGNRFTGILIDHGWTLPMTVVTAVRLV